MRGADIGVAPPHLGTIFRVVDFPPAAEVGAVDNAAMLKKWHRPAAAHSDPRHATMHRTRSVDYAVVMSGEIRHAALRLEVHLGAGDVLVQRGTSHAWVNRGKESCRIAFVLIDAAELPR